jgi:hypothetical protein
VTSHTCLHSSLQCTSLKELVKTVGRDAAGQKHKCRHLFDLRVPVAMAATASDSLSDSSDEEEEVDVGALKRLEEQLAANPADYNSHVEVWTQALLTTQLHQGACPIAGLNCNFDIMHDIPNL